MGTALGKVASLAAGLLSMGFGGFLGVCIGMRVTTDPVTGAFGDDQTAAVLVGLLAGSLAGLFLVAAVAWVVGSWRRLLSTRDHVPTPDAHASTRVGDGRAPPRSP